MKPEVDVEESVDTEFNMLINNKSDQFKNKLDNQPKQAPLIKKSDHLLERSKLQSAFVPESDDSKSEHRVNLTKASNDSRKEVNPEPKKENPPEIDFFDDKVEQAHKEIEN